MQNQSFEQIVIDPWHFGHQKMRSFEPHRTNMELDLFGNKSPFRVVFCDQKGWRFARTLFPIKQNEDL